MAGCSTSTDANPSLTLATTTSTQDSGLLDVLVPLFAKETGIEVKVVAVGSGQALEIGRRGDADVLLTHAPEAEKQFMSDGDGESRREVMYNDFVLVGPKEDPAHVQGQTSIVDALRQIAAAKATFVSRGDESGTHMKEKAIWKQATVTPQGDWYLSAGTGMAATLRLASEKHGYVLADRGTFLSQQEQLELVILGEGDALLRNVYAVIVINPAKHNHLHHSEAQRFADFLSAAGTQELIGKFGADKCGQALFVPLPSGSSVP
ncbi:MAG: ABC transporter substrate-binding protein [Pirellulaceae bacterium]